jgi:hypothetical protein
MTPVINELIYAVSLGFFDDILIPHQNLQHPKRLYPLAMLKTLFIKFNVNCALCTYMYILVPIGD